MNCLPRVAPETAAAVIQAQISSNIYRVTMLLMVQIWQPIQETKSGKFPSLQLFFNMLQRLLQTTKCYNFTSTSLIKSTRTAQNSVKMLKILIKKFMDVDTNQHQN